MLMWEEKTSLHVLIIEIVMNAEHPLTGTVKELRLPIFFPKYPEGNV